MADINYVPQISYTSRDYTAIKEDMISLIDTFLPTWTNRDTSDFGITLIELFAYMGDILNYYIDRSANEAFISTASQRDSVLQIARLLAYSPTAATAASVTLTFYNSTASPITVPALTKVATSASTYGTNQIVFETATAVTVPAKSGSVNGQAAVVANQGYTVSNEQVGQSSGDINQIWQISQSPVIQGTLSVVAGATNYAQVPYLIDYNSTDPVFSTYTNANKETYILFGDGVSGRIPDANAIITTSYRVGGGVAGNVAASALQTILTNNTYGLTVKNLTAASGGAEEETTDSIRVNAPLSIKSLNRAVSLADYAALAKNGGAAKANATADVYTSVTVYAAPYGDDGLADDGVTPSDVFNTLATTLATYFKGKIPANTTVTFQPPAYVPVSLSATITVLPQYKKTLVSTAVNTVITNLFAFDNVVFQDTITLTDVMSAITSVQGVAYAEITKLARADADITATLSTKAASGTAATMTTAASHGLLQGDTISIVSTDSTFNGTFVVATVPTSTSFTYALSSATILSASVTGTVTKLTVKPVVCHVNEIPQLNTNALALTFNGGLSN